VTRRALLAVALMALYGCGVGTEATLKKSPAAPGTATPPPVPSPPTPPRPAGTTQQPPVRPELPPGEEQRLAEGARKNIGDVERLVAELEGRPLKPPQREALQAAKSFLEQAQTALGQRDYPRAANLASKARALTDDLAATSK
jgi:hypothetical protein